MLEENHSRVQSRSLSNVSFFIHKVVRTPFYMCKYEGIYKIRLKETLNLHDNDIFLDYGIKAFRPSHSQVKAYGQTIRI